MATSAPIGDVTTTGWTPSAGSTIYETIDDYPGTGDYSSVDGENESKILKIEISPMAFLPSEASLFIYLTAATEDGVYLERYTLVDGLSNLLAEEDSLHLVVDDISHEMEIPIVINPITVSGSLTTLELEFSFEGDPTGVSIYGLYVDWTPILTFPQTTTPFLMLLSSWPH